MCVRFFMMSLARPRQMLLLILAVPAMILAQLFGVQRGYVCDCGGQAHVTGADHCHAAGGAHCHDEDHHGFWHGAADHHEEDDPLHEHAALIEALGALPMQSMAWSVPPLQVSWLGVSACLITSAAIRAGPAAGTFPPWIEPGRKRSWPHLLAHAIELRV